MTFIGKLMHAYRANRDKQGFLIQTLFVSTNDALCGFVLFIMGCVRVISQFDVYLCMYVIKASMCLHIVSQGNITCICIQRHLCASNIRHHTSASMQTNHTRALISVNIVVGIISLISFVGTSPARDISPLHRTWRPQSLEKDSWVLNSYLPS